jgi:hypothetical protein
MFNSNLSDEEAKQYIKQRSQEVENYVWQKQLGYGENRSARWIFILVILVVLVGFTVLH